MKTRTWIAARPFRALVISAVCCLALTAGALLLQAQTSLSDMLIRFSDGTIQKTAAHNCVDPANPDDEMIRVGGICIDKYEASIWDAAVGGNQIIGTTPSDYCNPNGQDCTHIYARSVAGVQPAAEITWFQAQQALANSGKRLPTNAEWQMAVSGTPDTGDADDGATTCNTDNLEPGVALTGSRSACVSRNGALDMVGNLWEWVADWVPASTACPFWGGFSDDTMCLSGASTTALGPGAFVRGGDFSDLSFAGPFAVNGSTRPLGSDSLIGFRGAR